MHSSNSSDFSTIKVLRYMVLGEFYEDSKGLIKPVYFIVAVCIQNLKACNCQGFHGQLVIHEIFILEFHWKNFGLHYVTGQNWIHIYATCKGWKQVSILVYPSCSCTLRYYLMSLISGLCLMAANYTIQSILCQF